MHYRGTRPPVPSRRKETGGGLPLRRLVFGTTAIRTSSCDAQRTNLERVALVNRLDSARGHKPEAARIFEALRLRPLAAGHLVRSVETR